jgi:Fe/S biogenesis protein NfuA
MVDVTVKQGIESRLKEVFPQISGIVDATDHAGGTNPYYR